MAESDQQADQSADQSDAVKPWTIKGIMPENRNAAIAAAKRADMAIGEWLTRAIRTQVQADRQENRTPVKVDQGPTQSDSGSTLADVERMIAMAQQLSTITSEPPPKTITRMAYGLLRDRLKAAKGK